MSALAALRVAAAEPPNGRLLTQYLQPDTTYLVGISPHLPTTIIFPNPGLGFQGVGLMRAADTSAQPVQIEHAEGTNYFTVRAIMPDARSDLNVVYEGRIYGFVFQLSQDPVRGLTLLRAPAPSRPALAAKRSPRVSVSRLVAILDEAKAYDVIAAAYPGYQRNITLQQKGYRILYLAFDVLVDQAWRFEDEDTIVLRCVFLNKTARPVQYRPDTVAIKVGERTFYSSISDASGAVPAAPHAATLEAEEKSLVARLEAARAGRRAAEVKTLQARLAEILANYQRGQSVAYFAITGNPDGTRAGISLKNNFNVLVATDKTP